MEALIQSGRVADLVLFCLAAEAVLLLTRRRLTGRGPGVADVAAIILPGVFLALALRFALAGPAWPWVPVALAGALAAHLYDLGRRLRRDHSR
ncbi:hypothetical protein GXW77_02570 [Roseomonas alkaliterrae]|uniref:Uncharacterized protein n=1 Tax=Neoroseomonas alkaliterrae TaxID=1452450 RepID=A0A840XT98_9PROT|nr:hypothetical protein [Neoroseomonas alkaliterrae]MBB5689889.1 hypothetical protein [Neoroseomonas alkaliterrae]MBR0675054.1 hypothetical protein [Neoroseomonas alkaliterrae]